MKKTIKTREEEIQQRMQWLLNDAFAGSLNSLKDVSHEAWRAITGLLQPDRLLRPATDSIHLLMQEITNPQEHGNNVANVLIAMEYLSAELFYNKATSKALLSQISHWMTRIEPLSKKVRSEEFSIIRRAILNTARFIHLSYAIANGKPGAYLVDTWELTTTMNRKKSFVVAAILMDHIITRINIVDDEIMINLNDLPLLAQVNFEVMEAQTNNHLLWAEMLKLTYIFNPVTAVNGGLLLARYEEALRSKDPLICGGEPLSDDEIQARLAAASKPAFLDVTEMAAAAVQHGWTTSQIENPFRLTVIYRKDQKVGGRTKVNFSQLASATQQKLWVSWNDASIEKQLRKQMGNEAFEREFARCEKDLFAVALAFLTVELDPRIVGYTVLTDQDKGNNVVATAMTWMTYSLERLEYHDSTQETVNELCSLIVTGSNPWNLSRPLLVRRAAEMHAIWAGRALQRDGIHPDRKHQVRLFNLLPKLGDEGIDKWSDEPHFDVEAVVNSLAYLVQGFVALCASQPFAEPCELTVAAEHILLQYPCEIVNK